MKTKTLELSLNGQTVSVEFTAKKVKNINIRIRANGCVCVSYPFLLPEKEVVNAVLNKADFILNSLQKTALSSHVTKEENKQRLGQFRKELTELCLKYYPFFENAFPFPEIRFKKMTSRWGSCMPGKNLVTFNTALAAVPPECAEYFVVHELCHFLHPNHSKSFYAEVEKHIPDWKERKKKLNSYHI